MIRTDYTIEVCANSVQSCIAAHLSERMRQPADTPLPRFIIGDTFNRVVFESHGYTIGLGDQLLKTIHGL